MSTAARGSMPATHVWTSLSRACATSRRGVASLLLLSMQGSTADRPNGRVALARPARRAQVGRVIAFITWAGVRPVTALATFRSCRSGPDGSATGSFSQPVRRAVAPSPENGEKRYSRRGELETCFAGIGVPDWAPWRKHRLNPALKRCLPPCVVGPWATLSMSLGTTGGLK
jgi:hypothetical protein